MGREEKRGIITAAGRRLSLCLSQDCEAFLLVRAGEDYLRYALNPEPLKLPPAAVLGGLLQKAGKVALRDIRGHTADASDVLVLHKAGYRQLAAASVCNGAGRARSPVAVIVALEKGPVPFACPEKCFVRDLAGGTA